MDDPHAELREKVLRSVIEGVAETAPDRALQLVQALLRHISLAELTAEVLEWMGGPG